MPNSKSSETSKDQTSRYGSGQFLTFGLERDTFALDVMQVREVLDLVPITRVPKTPDFMLGVINLRGSVVPVVDLRRKFALPAAACSRDSCIIVLEVVVEGENTVIGALADSVEEVLDLTAEQIEAPPKIGARLNVEFIRGMGKQDERFIIILDMEGVFSAEEMAVLQGSTAGADEIGPSCP